MGIIRAYFTLIRLPNGLMAMVAVAVGQYLTPISGDLHVNPFALAAAFFVCSFGNIVNDIRDLQVDRINHPRRALPSEAISLNRAKTLAFLFLLVSLSLTFWLNGVSRIIVALSIILVIWYNLRLKHTAYWGNLVVSLLGGLTFILGGASYNLQSAFSMPGPLIPAGFALLMHFGREIIKDIEDVTGDAVSGSRTAPVRFGAGGPLVLVGIVFIVLIAASMIVYLKGWFNQTYLYIILIGIYLPLAVQYLWLVSGLKRRKLSIVSMALKLEMVIGLIALLVGRTY